MSDPNERSEPDTDRGGNPPPASADTSDGQFDDQDMPTTDGEPAEPEPADPAAEPEPADPKGQPGPDGQPAEPGAQPEPPD